MLGQLHPVAVEARKERAWNSPEAIHRRALAEANEKAAQAMLESASPKELDEHIAALQVEVSAKRAAYYGVTNALARALSQKCT